MIGAGDNHHPPLNDPATPSHLGGSNHQEYQENPQRMQSQVPLDARTHANALGSLSQLTWMMNN
jgi:hypothetical protein